MENDRSREGIASVSVANASVYTVGYLDGREFLFALDAETGESRWITSVGLAVKESSLMRWLSQRTPTVDGDRLYTVTARGELFCLGSSDGQKIWQKSYTQDFGSLRPRWGFADRPLVDGEKLICAPAGTNGSIVALNKRTGDVVWKTDVSGDEREGYAATILAEAAGVRHYLVFLNGGLLGIAPGDGRILWRYSGTAARLGSSYTPMVQGDFVFSPNGYGGGMALLKIIRHGGGLRAAEQYHRPFQFNPFQDSAVLVGDYVYSFQTPGLPICIDTKSGELAWGPISTEAKDRAALTYAEGQLYVRRASGVMVLQKATPDAYIETSAFRIPDPEEASGATAPVVAGGRLYLRDNRRLLCYDISGDALRKPARNTKTTDLSLAWADRPKTAPSSAETGAHASRALDAIFVPTPDDVVARMLTMAEVRKEHLVYDLGSGDGRIVIAASRTYGSKAVGFEIDPDLVKQSRESVRRNGLDGLVTIEERDLFKADLATADVIALYLPPELLARLFPQLEKLKPGARIVSHQFRIPGFPPERMTTVTSSEDGEPHRVYLWTAPLKMEELAPEGIRRPGISP